MTEGNELDEILSETIAPDTTAETTTETPAAADTVNRDDAGRFAPKASETTTEPTDVTAQQAVENGAQPTTMVPQQALHAARQGEREAQAEAAELRRQMAELTGKVSVLTQQRQQPAAPQEQPKPKDFWDNPDDFVKSALTPVQEQMQRQALNFSKMLAVQAHGVETVKAAFKSFGTAMESDPQAQFEYQRIMASDHPYDELVTWHKGHEARARVGNDPDAWLKAEIEKLKADPTFQAEIIERARTGAAAPNANGQAPVTRLPPSLTRLPGGGNSAAEADVSDAGLFAHALAR